MSIFLPSIVRCSSRSSAAAAVVVPSPLLLCSAARGRLPSPLRRHLHRSSSIISSALSSSRPRCHHLVHACAAALLPLAGSSIGRRRGLPSPAMRLASLHASCLRAGAIPSGVDLVGVLLCWLSSASSSVAPPSPRRAPPPAPVLDAAPFLAADLPANHRPRVLRPAIHDLSRCSARGFSWPSLCASRGGFPSTGGAAAVGSQSAGAISIFPVVISSSAHLSFFSIQYTFSAAVSCYCKSLLGENRGSDYMSTGARSWLIIICYCCHVASNFNSSIGSNW